MRELDTLPESRSDSTDGAGDCARCRADAPIPPVPPAHRPVKFLLAVLAIAVVLGVIFAATSMSAKDTPPYSHTGVSWEASFTGKQQPGPLAGSRAPLMGVELPNGSDLRFLLNDFTKDGDPNRMERWNVPLGFDKTVAAMTDAMQPYTNSFDGIVWLRGATDAATGNTYPSVDWWWGAEPGVPLILVRIQKFETDPGTTVTFERRDS